MEFNFTFFATIFFMTKTTLYKVTLFIIALWKVYCFKRDTISKNSKTLSKTKSSTKDYKIQFIKINLNSSAEQQLQCLSSSIKRNILSCCHFEEKEYGVYVCKSEEIVNKFSIFKILIFHFLFQVNRSILHIRNLLKYPSNMNDIK